MLSISVLLQCNCYFLLPINLILWAALAPKIVASPLPNSNPLYRFHGQVRLCHLYTANEQTHLHLEIFSDGTVRGSRYQNPFSLMEIKAVKLGIICILAKKTSRFLCMQSDGRLYGSLSYSEEACNFHEMVLRDGYNMYYSEAYNLPVSLSMIGNLGQNRQLPPFSQFLPLDNEFPLEPMSMDYESFEQERNIESADPFNMMGQNQGLRSPSYAFR
ncbi:fibroblast growth factor 21 [Python bivittatus]|uniref:Fibroblast growth factor n=1 Tax=Python bivittatus TaxID=176946 RepID=A0A9F2RAP6_PYTBI|nr:fibroblast growth factor 21 [Python bivittatus]